MLSRPNLDSAISPSESNGKPKDYVFKVSADALYNHELSKSRILTKDEEHDLAKRIQETQNLVYEPFMSVMENYPFESLGYLAIERENFREKFSGEIDRSEESKGVQKIKTIDQLYSFLLGHKSGEIEFKESKEKLLELLKFLYRPLEFEVKKYAPVREILVQEKVSADYLLRFNEEVEKAERSLLQFRSLVSLMAEANMRLVRKLALKYYDGRVSLLDLVNEGNFGLLRAIEKFDCQKDNTFYAYAVVWIERFIKDLIPKYTRMISIPPKKLVMVNKLYKQSALFYRRHDRNPDDEESALIVRIDAEKIKHLKALPQPVISLNTRISDEEDSEELEGIITERDIFGKQKKSPEKEAFEEERRRQLSLLLSTLTKQEEKVLELVFVREKTLEEAAEELAKELGIRQTTRSNLSRIKGVALKKLRQTIKECPEFKDLRFSYET